ncbi:MAG: hypothetical protein ACOCUA_02570 [archaeon]
MVWPVTYVAFYVGILAAVLVVGIARITEVRTPWRGLAAVIPGEWSSRIAVGLVVAVLLGLSWGFPWTINQGVGLHGCYFTRFPHSALAGLGYGLGAGVVVAGAFFLAGLVPRRDPRAIATVVGFYTAFGLLLGVLHGLVFPAIRTGVGSSCPPLA